MAGDTASEVLNDDRRAGAVRGSPLPEGVRPNDVRIGGGGCALVLASSGTTVNEGPEVIDTDEIASSIMLMT